MATTIDLTPTWAQIAPVIALVLTDGTRAGQAHVMPEMHRMAALADERNAMARAIQGALDALAAAPEGYAMTKAKNMLQATGIGATDTTGRRAKDDPATLALDTARMLLVAYPLPEIEAANLKALRRIARDYHHELESMVALQDEPD